MNSSRYNQLAALKRLFIATVVSLLVIGQAVPQEEARTSSDNFFLGNQMLALGASLVLPLFTYLPTDEVDGSNITATNLSPGGKLSLNWNAFLNSRLTIGAEVSGMFAIDQHGEPLLIVPVTGRLGYQFSSDLLGLGQFEMPVFVNVGIGFMKALG